MIGFYPLQPAGVASVIKLEGISLPSPARAGSPLSPSIDKNRTQGEPWLTDSFFVGH